MTDRVVVVGSINQDLVIRVPHLPAAGETVLGTDATSHFGGKGANQAVAAARAGAEVRLVGAVGDDPAGAAALDAIRAEGVNVADVVVSAGPTGMALIVVDPRGENQIVVSPGANGTIGEALARQAAATCDVLVASFEVPMPTVVAAVAAARRAGATVVLDPAPAVALPDPLLHADPILTPNAGELATLSGRSDRDDGIAWLRERGIARAAVTLGRDGVLLIDGEQLVHLPGLQVEAVDATGAGDAFDGVLAAWLARGASFAQAVAAANVGGGMSVTAPGARGAMPRRRAIEALLARS